MSLRANLLTNGSIKRLDDRNGRGTPAAVIDQCDLPEGVGVDTPYTYEQTTSGTIELRFFPEYE